MITATKIHYSHKKFPILNGVDLEVEYGEFLVIVGPNGAGKSTLLNVLANEINKENNTILFKNKNFKDWNIKRIGLQQSQIFATQQQRYSTIYRRCSNDGQVSVFSIQTHTTGLRIGECHDGRSSH